MVEKTGANKIKATMTDGFGLYAVLTDPVIGYSAMTEILVKHNVAFVQLRMKERIWYDVMRTAQEMRAITQGSATRLIINDSAEIAAAIGADGVHVGQGDMPYAQVREIMGSGAIIGLSTHSPAQTREACALGPDYIGVGPVFPTPTKKIADPAIGVAGMRTMLSCATVPAVAIGGITLEALPSLIKAGARNFCMVRPLMQSTHPEEVLKRILDAYQEGITG